VGTDSQIYDRELRLVFDLPYGTTQVQDPVCRSL